MPLSHTQGADAAAPAHISHHPSRDQALQTLLQSLVDLTPTVLVDGVDASVSVLDGDGPRTAASSGPLANDLDACQYATGSGPCLHAARTGEITEVPDTRADRRWPAYARRAAERGALASLSVPLTVAEDRFIGSLNIYARRDRAFTAASSAAVLRLTGLATSAVGHLLAYQLARDRAQHLEIALLSRAGIEQAKGILMERHRLTPDQAFHTLARASMTTQQKVRDLAERLVLTGELPGGDAGADHPARRSEVAGAQPPRSPDAGSWRS